MVLYRTVSLSLRQTWFHRAKYLGLIVVIAVTTVLAVSQLSLMNDLLRGAVGVDDDSSKGQLPSELAGELSDLRVLLLALVTLTGVVGVSLTSIAVRSVMQSRGSELRLMRIVCMSSLQLRIMIALEGSLLALVIGVVFAPIGDALSPVLFALYKSLGAIGSKVLLYHAPQWTSIVLYAVIQSVVVGLSVPLVYREAWWLNNSHPANGEPDYESIWGMVARIAILGICIALLFALSNSSPAAGQIAILLPLLVTLGLMAVSVLILPVLVRVLARVLFPLQRGIFTLIQRTAWDRRRIMGRQAAPVLMAVGLLGGFLFASAADSEYQAYEFREGTNFQSYDSADGSTGGASLVALAEEVNAVYPRSSVAARVLKLDKPKNSLLISTSDSGLYVELLGGTTIEGEATRDSVIIPNGGIGLGSRLEAVDTNYEIMRVDAVHSGPWIQDQYILPMKDIGEGKGATVEWRFYSSVRVEDIRAHGLGGRTLMSKQALISGQQNVRAQSSLKGNVSIFGIAYVMCSVSLFHILYSTTRWRSGDCVLLRRSGVSRTAAMLLPVIETGLLFISSMMALLLVLAIVTLKFCVDLKVSFQAVYMAELPRVCGVFMGISIIGIMIVLGASRLNLREGDGGQ